MLDLVRFSTFLSHKIKLCSTIQLLKDIYEEGKSSGEHYGQAACAGRGKETDLEYIGLAFPC